MNDVERIATVPLRVVSPKQTFDAVLPGGSMLDVLGILEPEVQTLPRGVLKAALWRYAESYFPPRVLRRLHTYDDGVPEIDISRLFIGSAEDGHAALMYIKGALHIQARTPDDEALKNTRPCVDLVTRRLRRLGLKKYHELPIGDVVIRIFHPNKGVFQATSLHAYLMVVVHSDQRVTLIPVSNSHDMWLLDRRIRAVVLARVVVAMLGAGLLVVAPGGAAIALIAIMFFTGITAKGIITALLAGGLSVVIARLFLLDASMKSVFCKGLLTYTGLSRIAHMVADVGSAMSRRGAEVQHLNDVLATLSSPSEAQDAPYVSKGELGYLDEVDPTWTPWERIEPSLPYPHPLLSLYRVMVTKNAHRKLVRRGVYWRGTSPAAPRILARMMDEQKAEIVSVPGGRRGILPLSDRPIGERGAHAVVSYADDGQWFVGAAVLDRASLREKGRTARLLAWMLVWWLPYIGFGGLRLQSDEGMLFWQSSIVLAVGFFAIAWALREFGKRGQWLSDAEVDAEFSVAEEWGARLAARLSASAGSPSERVLNDASFREVPVEKPHAL